MWVVGTDPERRILRFFMRPGYNLLARPLWQIELHVLIHQESYPGRGQHPHDSGDDAAVETPPSFFHPRPSNDSLDASPKPRVSVVVLQPAADHLVWICYRAGDQLSDAGDDDGSIVAHSLLLRCPPVSRLSILRCR